MPKGAPGYGLSLAVGSVLTECPEWLDGEIGEELRRFAEDEIPSEHPR